MLWAVHGNRLAVLNGTCLERTRSRIDDCWRRSSSNSIVCIVGVYSLTLWVEAISRATNLCKM